MAITTFIPELWSARLLYNLENSHVATQLVNRDYEGIIRNQGDTVHINSIGEITVSDYTKNTDLADPEVLATTDQTLVIDQAKAFNFQVDDIDKAQAAGDIVNTAMQRAAYKLADASDAYLLKTIANGASSANAVGGTTGVALTAENVYENMVKLRTALDKANVPTAGRSVVVPPDVYALLLLDDRFVKASDAGTANSVLLNGEVGKVAGMSVFMSNNVAKKSSQWIVTAQVPYATTYAEQIISTEAYRMEKRFADGVKGLHVYGAKVTDSTAIASMLCTVG
jgi:N4-gp56 family major capsid protein